MGGGGGRDLGYVIFDTTINDTPTSDKEKSLPFEQCILTTQASNRQRRKIDWQLQ